MPGRNRSEAAVTGAMLATLKRRLWNTGLRHTRMWKLAKIGWNDRRKARALERLPARNAHSSEIRILVINHFFDGEIEALTRQLEGQTDISILSLTPEPFFSRAVAWFPESIERAEVPYDDSGLEAVRLRFRKYCEKLFQEINGRFPFQCILTPSDSFYWLREFILVCRRHGIPTLVADKEGTISPRSFAVEPQRITRLFPPIADRFFVWSDRQRRFWIRAGANATQVEVVGSMRSDLFVNAPAGEPRTLLCFDFDLDAYIANMDWTALGWTGERTWADLRHAVHRVLARVARKHPGLQVILKCHPQQVVTGVSTELLDRPNISILTGAPRGLPGLIADSYAVVGFQTTALLEAALAGKTVFYTAWGPLYERMSPHILPWSDSGYGITHVRSEEELERVLTQAVSSERQPDEPTLDRSRLSDYFHQADGHVTERLLGRLAEVVREGSRCRFG
ncbi:MAG: hypothetical protein ABSF53_24315 [Terracidiphilus sp.]|jgi:hypothetical protein